MTIALEAFERFSPIFFSLRHLKSCFHDSTGKEGDGAAHATESSFSKNHFLHTKTKLLKLHS